ncbi:MAG TPA: hypothetical protein VLM79_34465, partial [Kofleriaceae bacterium]|nr:hypothetical protein [Kofleriaceae bacterium]
LFVTKSIAGPFNFGLGAQLVPSAREVTTTTMLDDGQMATTTRDRAAFQVLAFVGIDVTIFPF